MNPISENFFANAQPQRRFFLKYGVHIVKATFLGAAFLLRITRWRISRRKGSKKKGDLPGSFSGGAERTLSDIKAISKRRSEPAKKTGKSPTKQTKCSEIKKPSTENQGS
jgi:hypothetical protein